MRTPPKPSKKSKSTSKKTYRTPKLTTHGDAAKLTQGPLATLPIGSFIRL
jgi:hypothetical protein